MSFKFEMHKWFQLEARGKRPCPRSGHSAVYFDNQMVITAGTSENNKRLDDCWIFNLEMQTWTQIPIDVDFRPRNGHSSIVHRDQLIVFGGISEITKELDDMFALDLKSRKWQVLQEGQVNGIFSPFKMLKRKDSNTALKTMKTPLSNNSRSRLFESSPSNRHIKSQMLPPINQGGK